MESRPLNALDILRRLPRTNCRECGVGTCLAFASQVVQGQKQLRECPYLNAEAIAELSSLPAGETVPGQNPEQALNEVKGKIRNLDFKEAAKRLGLEIVDDRLRVLMLGAIFDVDRNGDLHTLRHVNHWLHGPLLHYLLESKGKEPVGEWIPFSSLPDVDETAPFFTHFCEKAFQRLADEHTELFVGILEAFGKPTDNGLVDADVSVVLMPLPRVPFLYSYWKPEGEFPSRLSIHFDRTAIDNLDHRSIVFLATGLSEMFSRFIYTHTGK
jgi:Domain of unknown function (DUF3786)/Putative Fe-S cluster